MQVTKDTMVTYKMQYRGLKTTGKGGVLFLTMNFSEEWGGTIPGFGLAV